MKLQKKKYKFNKVTKILILGSVLIAFFCVLYVLKDSVLIKENKTQKKYISSHLNIVKLYNEDLVESSEIVRGAEVLFYENMSLSSENINYFKIKYEDAIYYVAEGNLADNEENIIKEEKLYVRTPATIYSNINELKIAGLANKGNELEVLGYDKINEDGSVNAYKIKSSDKIGYVYSKYVVHDEAESLLNYEPDTYYNIHNNRGDRYGGGHAGNLDYFPVIKTVFEDNIMPTKVHALYLNSGRSVINNVDAYIEFAKTTKINAFVVDIKDDGNPGYKSAVFEQFSPTNYKYANNTFDNYKAAINKIKQAGFYVIGRITVFKDKYYVIDNPDSAIIDSRTNEPYLHSNTYWPSPYQRGIWEFTVALAKEAVLEMGFDEIQFDYVRFPDRTIDAERKGLMLFKNDYNEEKAQAIQRFLMYACDELHKINAYVSADVFGESAYSYVTAYGQYWPAISNVVDVISGMPYPDHFNKYDFGFKEPVWTIPYDLLNLWGKDYVMKRQKEIPTPGVIRTWIQITDVPSYKHAGGYAYGDEQVEAQIKGLYDAGLTGGYMTWISNSSLDRYKSQIKVYSKEY